MGLISRVSSRTYRCYPYLGFGLEYSGITSEANTSSIGNLAKHAGLIPHSELVENYKPELIPETDDWTDTSFTWLDFDNRLRALKENNSGLNQNLKLTPAEKAEH